MSSINLSELIARKKFYVPVECSKLHTLLLKQIRLSEELMKSEVKHPRSGSFMLSWNQMWANYVISTKGLSYNKKTYKKLFAEFDAKGEEKWDEVDEAVLCRLGNLPWMIDYIITEKENKGCICEASCYPIFYIQLIKKFDIECNQVEVQDARLRCEVFLKEIFVGGLGGKEIVEKVEEGKWELLINDAKCQPITARIYEMLERATGEVLITGWIGTLLLEKIRELKSKGIDVKVITHSAKDAKGQPWAQEIERAYKELITLIGLENISSKPELHGRTIIVDNKAIVGSMDMNAYSLTGPHVEFAIYTEDVETVRQLRSYFKEMFVPLKEEGSN